MRATITTVVVRDRSRANTLTVVLLIGTEIFSELLTFFREQCNTLSTERLYVLALARFFEWLSVRANEFLDAARRPELYTAWVYDMQSGTYDGEEETHGLYWTALTKNNVTRLSGCLLKFSDWLLYRPDTSHVNPLRENATYAQQLMFWRSWNKAKRGSLVSHTKSRQASREQGKRGRRSKSNFIVNTETDLTLAFPTDRIDSLLWVGFCRKGVPTTAPLWERYNLRDLLITILSLFGGCRRSEPLHLWVDDVYIDPDVHDCALVRIYDPHDGEATYVHPMTGKKLTTTRADFLQRFCNGKLPLTLEKGRRHAGWKGNLLTEPNQTAFRVLWVDREAGRLFLSLWNLYITHVRPITPQLPWAFLTKELQPLGSDGFDDSFRAAVRRAGFIPCKALGTSSQGLRHRYGQWLNELEIDEKAGQIAMHHRNAFSQQVYREESIATIASRMADGALGIKTPE